MPVFSERLIDRVFVMVCCLAAACLASPGCGWPTAGGLLSPLRLPGDSVAAAEHSPQTASAVSSPRADAGADRAVLARNVEKDALGRPHSVWIRSVEPSAKYRWRYPDLDELLARPVEHRPDLPRYLADKDPIVATNAAIALARGGDGRGAQQLVAGVRTPQWSLPMRCAAVEALAALPATTAIDQLHSLLDQYGRVGQDGKSPYIAELHAELLRGLAAHVDAADDPRFVEALRSPSAEVRLEALAAWTASGRGTLPIEAADLRSNGDYRVRAAALEAMAKRRYPDAQQCATAALHDTDLRVRIAAIAALGELGGSASQTSLQALLEKQQPEAIRAAAVPALARLGEKKAVLEAATDKSWRVRLNVAAALAAWPDRDGSNAAERLLDDPSGEVQRAAVAALAPWPLPQAGPILLTAMGNSGVWTRKTAAEQLAGRWPTAAEFSFDAPPERRSEVLDRLRKRFRQEFAGTGGPTPAVSASTVASPRQTAPEQFARVQELVARQDVPALIGIGPELVEALELLVFDRQQVLPEAVYRDVLPRHSEVFAALSELSSTDVSQRRRAAERLVVLADGRTLGRLALGRLEQLEAAEPDQLVWRSVLMAVAGDPSEAAARLAYAAIGHASPEVRRRACEHLAAHPDPKHAKVLLPALQDPSEAVVCAAIRALGAGGRLDDREPLHKLLAVRNEQIRLETAAALARLGDPSGIPALERLAYSGDPLVQRQTAQVMGEIGDPSFTPALVHLLDKQVSVCRASLESLPKVVGRDASQADGHPTDDTAEQVRRWKQWYEREAGTTSDPVKR